MSTRAIFLYGLASAALAAAMPPSASAEGSVALATDETRAALFDSVCMQTAPSFESFEDAARANGLSLHPDGHHWYIRPDLMLTKENPKSGGCDCYMSFGGGREAVDKVEARLRTNHAGEYRNTQPGSLDQSHVMHFYRSGEPITVLLWPSAVGAIGDRAQLIVRSSRPCPTADGNP